MKGIKYVLLLCGFFFHFAVYSQQQFEGEYVFNGVKGTAKFNFVEGKEGEILKEGAFQFNRNLADSLDKTRFFKTTIRGVYRDNEKAGDWSYRDLRHQVTIKDIEEFTVDTELSSEEIRLRASYERGLPSGKWNFIRNTYSDGKLSPKASVEELSFTKGMIEGSFQYKEFAGRRTYFVRGGLLPGGIMNGEWTFVYAVDDVLISEVRNYDKGFLLGLVKRNLETDEVVYEQVFFKTIEKLREIEEGRNEGFRIADDLFGLTFNDGFLEEYEEYQEQQDANSLIEAFLLNTLRYDDRYISAGGQIKRYPLATRKFVYQIPRDDVPRLNEIPENYDRLKSVIREYAGKNSLNLNKNRSDSVARAYAFFQFYNRELERFDPLINVIRDKSIQYFDLRYMKENGISFLREEVNIPYVYDEEDKTFSLSYTVNPLEEGLYLSLLAYIAAVEEEVQRQAALVDRVLFFIEQNQSLRQLEAEIESQQRVIDRLYVEERGEQEPRVRRLVQDVYETVLERSYAALNDDYARTDNQERKVELANIKLDLLNELETVHPKLLRVYEILETVDEGYMVEVWNAFTFSRYMQREKERLWEAGELLYMHYIDALRSEEVYVELRVWIQKMENLAQRLNELREEDTRRLERRIGRTKDPKEIEELLELK